MTKRTWFRNIFRSMNTTWKHLADEIPGICLADNVFMTVKDAKKKGIKNIIPAAQAKINKSNVLSLKRVLDDVLPEESREVLKEGVKEVKHRVKTGKLYENRNRHETGRRNKDLNDMDDFMDKLDNIDEYLKNELGDDYGESYEGGIMINENLKMARIKLQQVAFAESLSLISDMEKTNANISKVCQFVLQKSAFCENLDNNPVNDVIVDDTVKEMKDSILTIAKPLSSVEVVDKTYSDPLGKAMAVAMITKANYVATAPSDDNIDKLLEEVKDTDKEVGAISPNVQEIYRDNMDDTVDDLQELKDDLVFDPIIDETRNPDNDASVANLVAASEDMADAAVGPIISTIMMVPAIIMNTHEKYSNAKFASKYGTNTTITQPLIATSSLSNETVKQLAKALEIKQGLQIKGTLEASVSAWDGGMVNSRLRQHNVLSPAKIDVKDAALFADKEMSYDQILQVFSEGKIITNCLGNTSSDILYTIPSMMSYFKENMHYLEAAMIRENLVGAGEAGVDLEDRRAALPTYLTVDIRYSDPKSIASTNRENKTYTTTVGIEVNPKIVSRDDLITAIKENGFAKIKVGKDERTFFNRFKDIMSFWRKKPNAPQAKVLKTTAMSKLFNKISNIKTPLFHIMLEYSDYIELKEKGIDLLNASHYSDVMANLPIISITIVLEDSGLVYMSEGNVARYKKNNLKDYVDEIGRVEKELRSAISFKNNL